MRNWEYYHQLVEAAEKAGLKGRLFEEALVEPKCRTVLWSRIENSIDGAESDIEHNDVFIFYIAEILWAWRKLWTDDDYANVADQLRGLKVLKGIGRKQCREGANFSEQPWWPK